MTDFENNTLWQRVAKEVRRDVIRMQRRGTGAGSALSTVDMLVDLYFGAMNYPSPTDPDRDRFILSKGHAAALYSVQAHRGVIDSKLLAGFLTDDSPFTGHPVRSSPPGIEVFTGSLGHGLSLAVGMAHAARLDGKAYRIFVMLGDGNGLQRYDRVDATMPTATMADKLRAFGWAVREVDGHDHVLIGNALASCPVTPERPAALLARTVKGKGVKEMEGQLGWHYISVPAAKVEQFLAEVGEGT